MHLFQSKVYCLHAMALRFSTVTLIASSMMARISCANHFFQWSLAFANEIQVLEFLQSLHHIFGGCIRFFELQALVAPSTNLLRLHRNATTDSTSITPLLSAPLTCAFACRLANLSSTSADDWSLRLSTYTLSPTTKSYLDPR